VRAAEAADQLLDWRMGRLRRLWRLLGCGGCRGCDGCGGCGRLLCLFTMQALSEREKQF